MKMPVLQTHNLSIGYGEGHKSKVVVSQLNLQLLEGELVALLGPNGVGKSTLLRTLSGSQNALQGDVHLHGVPLSQLNPQDLAKKMSVVLTDRSMIGLMTAFDVVALGRHPYTDWTSRLSQQDMEIITTALSAVGASQYAHRHIDQLSDGERQKVMIARALAQDTPVILLDEPTAFLDLPHRVEVLGLLQRLAQETGKAVLLSTHDLDHALRLCDQIWLMGDQGRVVTGAPEDIVLSGALARAFAGHPYVQFDVESGAFVTTKPIYGEINVIGEGASLHWAQRAIERVGFRVVNHGDQDALILRQTSGGWQFETPHKTKLIASFYELAQVLNALKQG